MASSPVEAEADQIHFTAANEADTLRLAATLARVAATGDVLALYGPLGAGKTAFARGFVRALTRPEEEVPSPTFTLIQLYEGSTGPIYHFDLYRIEDESELQELGLEEAAADGITLIEWPERAETVETDRWLHVRLALDPHAPDRREITLEFGAGWRDRIDALKAALAKPTDA